MFEKLATMKERLQQVLTQMADPDIISDQSKYRELASEHRHLSPIIEAYDRYESISEQLEESKLLLEDDDADIRAMAQEELSSLRPEKEALEDKIKILLLPKDPNDERNVILEVRAGTGGDEAALFAADVFRMYTRYAEAKRWKLEIITTNETELGGMRDATFSVAGEMVYSRLKFEAGVHRVQRVPTTETQGRVHTSACTVAVLPEADEVELNIPTNDLKIDVYRSSGPGGQSVNTTDSAVRITHLPTGLVVTCQDEKSQIKNKAKALKVLRARLLEKAQAEADAERAADRRAQVGSGDRSERIRTYNFPQNRMTDHRVGLTLYKLEQIMMGDLDELLDGVSTYFQAQALSAQAEEE